MRLDLKNSIIKEKSKIDLLFICGGKDFHAMDKFKLALNAIGENRIILVTDTIEGEAQKSLVQESYPVEKLFIIDRFTPNYQSKWTHLWRNIIKIIFLPIQIWRLKKIYRYHEPAVVHAVPIYYMLLCRLAAIPYIGTPQADEILVRPLQSSFYNLFAKLALKGASTVIVDSLAMKTTIENRFQGAAVIIKNGFDTGLALSAQRDAVERKKILSIRGLQDNYQISEIIQARNRIDGNLSIDFVFPFFDINCLSDVKREIQSADQLHGLLPRNDLYLIMGTAILCISIPLGDSSPRSVYEAIFCGAAVAITPMGFYDELPACMKSRIYLVDLNNDAWFREALEFAKLATQSRYVPSNEALIMCDQTIIINAVIKNIYKIGSETTVTSAEY